MQIKYDQMPLKYKLEEEETTVWSHFGKKIQVHILQDLLKMEYNNCTYNL